jgi:hypothetical protein
MHTKLQLIRSNASWRWRGSDPPPKPAKKRCQMILQTVNYLKLQERKNAD